MGRRRDGLTGRGPDLARRGRSRVGNAARWLFEDRRTGKIVVGQRPNLLLLVFAGAFAVKAVASGPVGTAAQGIETGSLALWAADELGRGVNPFRRIGGAVVLLAMLGRALG